MFSAIDNLPTVTGVRLDSPPHEQDLARLEQQQQKRPQAGRTDGEPTEDSEPGTRRGVRLRGDRVDLPFPFLN